MGTKKSWNFCFKTNVWIPQHLETMRWDLLCKMDTQRSWDFLLERLLSTPLLHSCVLVYVVYYKGTEYDHTISKIIYNWLYWRFYRNFVVAAYRLLLQSCDRISNTISNTISTMDLPCISLLLAISRKVRVQLLWRWWTVSIRVIFLCFCIVLLYIFDVRKPFEFFARYGRYL
jgi:hypothetical protein